MSGRPAGHISTHQHQQQSETRRGFAPALSGDGQDAGRHLARCAITGCAMPRHGTFDTGCMRWCERSRAWHRFCILPLCVTERPCSI